MSRSPEACSTGFVEEDGGMTEGLTTGRGSMVFMRCMLIAMSALAWTTASANAEWRILAQPMKLSCGPVSKTTTGCGSEVLIGDNTTSQVIVCNADYQLTAK